MKSQNFVFLFCLLTFSINSFPQISWPNKIRVHYKTSSSQAIDDIVIRFSNDPTVTTSESSYWDARSLNCCTFIASLKGNTNFAIQTRPLSFNRDTVKLRVASTSPGNFKLTFTDFQYFVQAKEILLLDKYLKTQQEVKANPSYDFNITSDLASHGAERFQLVFVSEQLVIECPENVIVNNSFGSNGANILFNLSTPVAKCSNPIMNFSHQPGSFFPIGNTKVTVDAYDLCGNTSNCSFVITVKDVEPPLMLSPLSLNYSADQGSATYSFIPVIPVATDNHKLIDVQGFRDDGKALEFPYPIGTTKITWKATDSSGNVSSVMQFVIVKDNEAPIIVASDMHLNSGSNNCSVAILNNPVTITDNSGNVNYVGTRSDGAALSDPYPVGATSITWLASDVSGNSVNAIQQVLVKDNIAPIFTPTVNNSILANIIGCKSKISGTAFNPLVYDNCSVAILTNNFNNTNSLDGAELPQGINNILWTASDASGNTNTWLQIIEVAVPNNHITIPDALTLPGKTEANTIYLGYEPAAVLSYNSAVTGAINYQWTVSSNLTINGASNTPIVNVTASNTSSLPYTITLSTTDILGCAVSATKEINVINVKCGKNKVMICSPLSRELCVSTNSLSSYFLTGYKLGSCNSTFRRPSSATLSGIKESSFKTFPNPGNGLINLQFNNYENTKVEVRIYDVLGKLVFSRILAVSSATETMQFDLQKNAAGIYNMQVIARDQIKSTKIVIVR